MTKFKIESEEDFRAWLEGKPREVSVVLASRMALRVFPMVAHASYIEGFDKTIVLSIFWANILPWVAAKYPTHDKDLEIAVHATTAATTTATMATAHATTATTATIATTTTRVASAHATTAAAHAAHATSTTAGATTDFWEALTTDCLWMQNEGHHAASILAAKPLWLNEVPKLVDRAWHDLTTVLRNKDYNWWVWINWYEARLHGHPTIDAPADIVRELDLGIALIDEKLWKKGPLAVNAEVQRLIDEAKEEAREREEDVGADESYEIDGVKEVMPIEGIPSPATFEWPADSPLRVVSGLQTLASIPSFQDEEDRRQRAEAAIEYADSLRQGLEAGSHQVRQEYKSTLDRYCKWIPQGEVEGNIHIADAAARNLRTMFQADNVSLSTGFAAELKTFLEQHIH